MTLPVTIWKPGQGQGEMSSNGGLAFKTLQGAYLVTQSNEQIINKESTYTELAATEWVKDDGE